MTVTPFTPATNGVPFVMQPTLDGSVYTLLVTWNIYAQRWYFALFTLQNVQVLEKALIASPAGHDIDLVWPLFNSMMVFREDSQAFEVTP